MQWCSLIIAVMNIIVTDLLFSFLKRDQSSSYGAFIVVAFPLYRRLSHQAQHDLMDNEIVSKARCELGKTRERDSPFFFFLNNLFFFFFFEKVFLNNLVTTKYRKLPTPYFLVLLPLDYHELKLDSWSHYQWF